MRPLIQLLWHLKRTVLRVTRWKTRGVKVMLFNPAGELLLIRNTYGRSHLHVLPGGGIHRGETPEQAAAREVKEEVGIACEAPTFRGVYRNHAEGKRDTIYLFTAVTSQIPRPDGVEVAEAAFHPLDALPETVSAATRRRIEEYREGRGPAADW